MVNNVEELKSVSKLIRKDIVSMLTESASWVDIVPRVPVATALLIAVATLDTESVTLIAPTVFNTIRVYSPVLWMAVIPAAFT